MVVDRVCLRGSLFVSCTSVPSLYRRLNWKVRLEDVAVAWDELRNGLAEADLFCVLRFSRPRQGKLPSKNIECVR
jgi:hypothetical protein